MYQITPELLKKIVPAMPLSKRQLYAPLIQAACLEFDITTEDRVAGFLAQCAHESDSFKTLEEYASGAAYDRRKDLGNTKPEAIAAAKRHGTTPGRFYKGHGAIQTTGYSNHVLAGDALGIDLVEEPGLLATPEHAFRSAGFFWQSHNLNRLADKRDIRGMTKIVNGGYNGLAQRTAFYERALMALPDGFELTEETAPEEQPATPPEPAKVNAEEQELKGVTTSAKPPEETAGTLPPAPAAEVKASQVSLLTKVTSATLPVGLMGVLGAIGKFVSNLPPYVWIAFAAVVVVAIVIGYLVLRDSKRQAHERTLKVMDAAADPNKNNLRLV